MGTTLLGRLKYCRIRIRSNFFA